MWLRCTRDWGILGINLISYQGVLHSEFFKNEIKPFEIECFEFQFNNAKYVNEVFDSYKNRIPMKDLPNEYIVSTNYILAAKCNDVGFVVGGDNLKILSHWFFC